MKHPNDIPFPGKHHRTIRNLGLLLGFVTTVVLLVRLLTHRNHRIN